MFGADQLIKNNLVALNEKRVGVIKHRELPLDENGKTSENWVIKGPTLQGIFNQRTTVPPSGVAYDYKSGDAETIMKHYVDNNAINPIDRNRKFIMLKAGTNLNRGVSVNWQSRFKTLSEELTDISLATDIGWDVYIDSRNKWWVFDCIEGRDLTVMDGEHQPVTFSIQNNTISSQHITDSDINMRNVAYVGGEGEGELRDILEIGDYTDLNRSEVFIDARDVGSESSNGESLAERGGRKLKELETEFFYEAEVKTTNDSPFVYIKDYDLGDIVKIVDKNLGIQRTARITEIKEIYERDTGFRIELTFGYSRPTVFEKIKNKFTQFDTELKK